MLDPKVSVPPSCSLLTEAVLDELAAKLTEQGYAIIDQAFSNTLIQQLRAQFARPDCPFKTAGIGRREDFTVKKQVRGDRICWLSGESDGPRQFLAAMENVRAGLNRRLFLGLFDYESHLAYYPVGAFYKRHVDAFVGRSNRVLSTVLYLNHHWDSATGGELLLYRDDTDAVQERIVPSAGKLVVFLSERFPHEVLAATRERYSVAGWFRVNASVTGVLDPPS